MVFRSVGIKDVSSRCQHHPTAGVCWHRTPAPTLKSHDAADTRIPQCSGCLLHITAYPQCPCSTHLFAMSHNVQASADTRHSHVQVSSWTWMIIVSMRHPPQPSEQKPICQLIEIPWPHPVVDLPMFHCTISGGSQWMPRLYYYCSGLGLGFFP